VANIHIDHFLLLERYEVNASAAEIDGKRILLINKGILRLLENDPDALAALFGHEIAHLKLEHGASRKSVNRTVGIGAQTLGIVASLFIPGVGNLVNMGGNALSKAYTRDQEREADKLGLEYAVQAGYEAIGMVRLLNVLPVSRGSNGSSGFFDSHPGKKERIGYVEALIRDKYDFQMHAIEK
jgi:predicted Zn-dependent protease